MWAAFVAACSNPPANPDVSNPSPDAADVAMDSTGDRSIAQDASDRDAVESDRAMDAALDALPDVVDDLPAPDARDAAPDTFDAQGDGIADVVAVDATDDTQDAAIDASSADSGADASADSNDGGCGLCAAGNTCCSGRCVNLRTDPDHCGACGRSCVAGAMVYYDFNEGSGTSFVERVSATPFPHNARYATGVRGSALEFDGTTSGQATTSGWRSTGAYTWTFWIYPTSTQSDWSVIYHRGTDNLNRQSAMYFYANTYSLHMRSGTVADWNAGCDSSAMLAPNRWSFVALVHDASGIRAYIDGTQTCTIATTAPVPSAGPLYIGDSPWFVGMVGRLDEFRVFDRALTLAELTAVRALQ